MNASKAGALLATLIALIAGGCGESSRSSSGDRERPERVVSLSPSGTWWCFRTPCLPT
jgi:hypothetical protein